VDSGQKALDMIRAGNTLYDVVFLDQMMPEMDGLETADRIRALGTEYAKNLTIIAFTANAVSGNEEMLLNKGFQDILTKPIDIKKLNNILMKWVRNKEKDEQYKSIEEKKISLKEDVKSVPSFLADVKIKGLKIQDGVRRFSNNESTYLHVLRTYATDTRNLLTRIESIDENDFHNYEVIVHGIKGSSKDICAPEVGKLAEKLEVAAKNGDINYLIENNPDFLKTTRTLIFELDKLLEKADRDNPLPKKDKPDKNMLDKLLQACGDFDIDEVDAVMEEIKSFQYTDDDGLFDWLQEKADLMRFSEIIEKLTALQRGCSNDR